MVNKAKKMMKRYLRKFAFAERMGRSQNSLDDLVRAGLCMKPVKVQRMALWPEDEAIQLMAAFEAGMSIKEVKDLVIEIESNRAEAAAKLLEVA
ncbi:MAG: hypothetical protein HOL17_06190 [Gammaproteobacteria bacterium]|jgi:hypothetical protein|nr:hypothetical protein [Gammaproteobacteria bacterium]MBT7829771.1 hypothetical protein [Candidatus Neomarinimicrobiota bacterium]MBT4329535.1 hypothetical protein [Gammaproteobacteria bacterium]MBT5371297.1 hypothetical protein [Gammaproteobacteria bacterium]MBT5635623.1 hypothetical protein [Gammaproteobacteria bacterium]